MSIFALKDSKTINIDLCCLKVELVKIGKFFGMFSKYTEFFFLDPTQTLKFHIRGKNAYKALKFEIFEFIILFIQM